MEHHACSSHPGSGPAVTTPRPAITGISHLTLFADDLPKSEQFYVSLLGWEQVPAAATKSGVRYYANHSQYVELLTPPPQGILADRLDAVAFTTSDAEALRKYLGANGVKVPATVTKEQNGDISFMDARSSPFFPNSSLT